jgi:hypothetical protein
MQAKAAIFTLGVALGVIVFAMAVSYLTCCVIHGIRVYLRFRGTRLVTCPEIHKAAVVGVAPTSMGMQAILDQPCLWINQCSHWPMRIGCGQDCLKQIQAR